MFVAPGDVMRLPQIFDMPGLVPGIRVLGELVSSVVDGRDEPGQDGGRGFKVS